MKQQRKIMHEQQKKPTTTTIVSSIITTTNVSGANQLKKYIQEITEVAKEIRKEFEDSLKQPKAIVEYQRTESTSTHNFNAEMSRVSHDTFVYNNTRLIQSSKFLQADGVMIECLGLLEIVRKMLVNNKQQKKTRVRNIRTIINELKRHQQQWIAFLKPAVVEIETEVSSPSIERLEKEIETTKQNHRTITNRLLTQANTLVLAMRRHIFAFKVAAEDSIGEIIHNAVKCRAFIAKCRRLEVIDFCASMWWFDTQHSEFIAQHPELSERHFTVSVAELEENDRIKFVVQCFDPMVITVGEYEFDQAHILTDEALQAFEAAEQEQEQERQQQQQQYQQNSWYGGGSIMW